MIIVIFFICSTLSCMNISQAQNSPQDYLEVHNQARKEVGVGPLYWNHTLETYAQNYANNRIDDCKVDISMGPYGENIASGYGVMNGTGAVQVWLSAKPYYDYHSNSCAKIDECVNYTQIIWRNTVHLGCAMSKCKNGKVFVICSYSPPGNIEGQRPY